MKSVINVALTMVVLVTLIGCSDSHSPVEPAAESKLALADLGISSNPDVLAGLTLANNVIKLTSDMTVDATFFIPDGYTLDGNGHTITAVDPAGDHFRGAVVQNAGSTAHVKNLAVRTSGLSNACDSGGDRLRGIMFEGASGSIKRCEVVDVNQGASGCQEGNAIEVRNAPFDGTHPNTVHVEVAHNKIKRYQKTGIVANGDVEVLVHHNKVGASATQENLAANSIQLGFGAQGTVRLNKVDGNQWKGTSNFAASAILVFDADAVKVNKNIIRGNSDIGLFVISDDGEYVNNKIFDNGADHPNSGFDIGGGDFGSGNTFKNNKARGFDDPFVGVSGGTNKAIPGPMRY